MFAEKIIHFALPFLFQSGSLLIINNLENSPF
jgi:hypothetical protein